MLEHGLNFLLEHDRAHHYPHVHSQPPRRAAFGHSRSLPYWGLSPPALKESLPHPHGYTKQQTQVTFDHTRCPEYWGQPSRVPKTS